MFIRLYKRKVVLAVNRADHWSNPEFHSFIKIHPISNFPERVAEADLLKLDWKLAVFLLQQFNVFALYHIILLKYLKIFSNISDFLLELFNEVLLFLQLACILGTFLPKLLIQLLFFLFKLEPQSLAAVKLTLVELQFLLDVEVIESPQPLNFILFLSDSRDRALLKHLQRVH